MAATKSLCGLRTTQDGGLTVPLTMTSFVQGIQFLVKEGFMKITN